MGQGSLTRREFIRVGTGAMAATTAAKVTIIEPNPGFARSRAVAPSDTVRFASIGSGVRGCELLEASLRVPGVECVARSQNSTRLFRSSPIGPLATSNTLRRDSC